MTIKSSLPASWLKRHKWWDNTPFKNENSLIARDFGRDIEDVFNNFLQRFDLNLAGSIFNEDIVISPNVNLSETDKEYIIEAEMPGIDEENLELDISDDKILKIKGKNESFKDDKSRNYHSVESIYGSFKRELYLPDNCDTENVKASLKNGMLKINIPKTKTEPSHIKKIELNK